MKRKEQKVNKVKYIVYIKIKNLNAKYIQERERKKINIGKKEKGKKYMQEKERKKNIYRKEKGKK